MLLLSNIKTDFQFMLNPRGVKLCWSEGLTKKNREFFKLKHLRNLNQTKSFKIHPINFMSLSAIKLDQRMLSSDPSSTANVKR